jgi:hypothetical protein
MLIVIIHKDGRTFHPLNVNSSLIFLLSGLQFLLKCTFVSLFQFMPRYFIDFEAIVNGIVSMISFSVCDLLQYRNVTDFYMLILFPATLQKEFMISSSFL